LAAPDGGGGGGEVKVGRIVLDAELQVIIDRVEHRHDLRFFGDDAKPMDAMLDDAAAELRVHVSARSADVAALKARLERAKGTDGKGGEISLVASLERRSQGEPKLPGRYRPDRALPGALETAPGVDAQDLVARTGVELMQS